MKYILFLVLILLNVVDLASSYFIFSRGFGHEGNKFMASLIARAGLLPGLALPKLLMLIAVGVLVSIPTVPWYALGILVLFYLWVAYNNLAIVYNWKKKQT